MANRALISIITPTFKHEKYIAQCIESVIAQTYSDWEMIIVDDGSPDRTGDIVGSYVSSDDRIKYYRQINRGIWRLSETYNYALSIAKGEYIAIIEGDDVWPAYKLQLQMEADRSGDFVLSYGRFERFFELAQLPVADRPPGLPDIHAEAGLSAMKGLLCGTRTIMPVSAVIRKKHLDKSGGFVQPSYYPAVEHPTWLNLVRHGSICYIDAVLGYWRRHEGQASDACGLELSDGTARYNIEYFSQLDDGLKQELGLSLGQLEFIRKTAVSNAYFVKGRYQLLRGDRAGAVNSFRQGLGGGRLSVRIKSLIALIAAITGVDLEALVNILGRGRYK